MEWPKRIPPDLSGKLERGPLSYRQTNPQELWDEIAEWLEAHGVECPDDLPTWPVPGIAGDGG